MEKFLTQEEYLNYSFSEWHAQGQPKIWIHEASNTKWHLRKEATGSGEIRLYKGTSLVYQTTGSEIIYENEYDDFIICLGPAYGERKWKIYIRDQDS